MWCSHFDRAERACMHRVSMWLGMACQTLLQNCQITIFLGGATGFNETAPYFSGIDKSIDSKKLCVRVSETAETTSAIYYEFGIGGIGGMQYAIAKCTTNMQPILGNELY